MPVAKLCINVNATGINCPAVLIIVDANDCNNVIAEEINDTDAELEQINHDDNPEWDGNIEGYERIGSDEKQHTDFDGYHNLYTTLFNIFGGEEMTVEKFAAWAGATAVWEAKDKWIIIYYKKIK